jgi:DNA polymerase-3 subunit gamma/tau
VHGINFLAAGISAAFKYFYYCEILHTLGEILMSYVALYRKYRPQSFSEIVGQDAIVTTLRNQLKNGKIGHAYLFCGMRGTGKTSTARVFAKSLNCEKGPAEEPCNVCASCQAISNGSMIDVIEMDAASNRGIDDVRDLREKVNFAPSEGRYKIYIIDEVHMLTSEAFNALLKTLEEPPAYVVFILATTEPNKLPSTILSRCMRFDFTRISTTEIVARLKEIVKDLNISAQENALAQIAGHSQGSVRDALSLLDKALAFSGGKLTYEDILTLLGAVRREVFFDISEAVIRCDITSVMNIVDELAKQGKDLFRFMDDTLNHFRNLLMTCLNVDRELIDVIDEDYIKLQKISKKFTKEKLLSIINILKEAENDAKWSSQPRIIVESALAKLTIPELWEKEEGYIARIQQLEQRVASLENQLQNTTPKQAVNQPTYERDGFPMDPALKTENTDISSQVQMDKAPEEKSKEDVSEESKEDYSKALQVMQEAWPKVLKSLQAKRKMTLISSIKAGDIKPAKVEKSKLYLLNSGDRVYEEIIMAEKHTIEKEVKDITGIDIFIKGFVTDSNKNLSNQRDSTESSSDLKLKNNRKDNAKETDEFSKQIIDFFGEENVTFED